MQNIPTKLRSQGAPRYISRNRFSRSTKLDTDNNPKLHDYYAILSIAKNATSAEIKAAYHRALLLYHPDKQLTDQKEPQNRFSGDSIDIGTLKVAFNTLTSPELRAQYDAARSKHPSGPRPAQVISLEDFYQLELEHDHSEFSVGDSWAFDCRCGGKYVITERMMEEEHHLVGCNSCSETVWVGYEVADEEEE
ncbi:hypothetical protein QCA50_007600 [Cerrena zonata]|uniref:Diphthamide biosynthesis protein 4 n=1 Tax=Cerrena zonata TaxID=2478898 RepID=A0AAW0GC49_9APHY